MLFRQLPSIFVGFVLAAFVAACSGGSTQEGSFAPENSGSGYNGSFKAGARAAALQVSKSAGAVLTHPVLQLVTFNRDADAAALSDFAKKLTSSSYWAATTQEYGVGALTAVTQQLTVDWGTSATDGDLQSGAASTIEAYLISQLDGASPAWGAPDPNAIYALMMPSGVAVSPNGGGLPSACDANILSWHTAMLLPSRQVAITYVVVPYCGARGAVAELDARTVALSHAVVSAATDPLLNAYNTLDSAHLAWQVATNSPEVGAACAAALGAEQLITKPADLGYAVQRIWSNAAALAGQMPCVPAAAQDVYFSSVPQIDGSVPVAMSSNPSVSRQMGGGVAIASGSSQSVTLQLSSTGPTSGPWTVSASELGSGVLQFAFDKTTGNNGDQIKLTVRMTGVNAASSQELVRVTSTLGSQVSHEYFVVHND